MASGTKDKINEAALALFASKGVADTTTRELAQSAGIAEGTLYRHYLSKDDLVRELFREHYLGFARRIEIVQAGHRTLAAKMRAIVESSCRLFDEQPTLYRFLLLILNETLPHLPASDDGPVQVLQTMFAQAIAAGECRLKDPRLAAALFLGLLIQPASSLIHGGLDAPLGRYADDIAAVCAHALAK